ncbi:MAG: PfkB family carbohydrate kinase, partial [Aquiluna sp.]
KRVVVLGDVIEDIIVISDSARQLNTDNPAEINSKPGGSGANFAVWLASLGVEVELVARVGAADRARLTNYFETKFVIAKLEPDEKLTAKSADLSKTDVLYLSGYAVMSMGIQRTQQLIEKAGSVGVLIAVDPGSRSFISQFGPAEFLQAISGADFIFPNSDEYELLSKHANLAENFPEVIVTSGEEGAEVLGIAKSPAFDVEVVDSTGAGDAFAAKYLAQRLAGVDVEDALRDANAFAAQAVTKPGGQP